MSESESTRHVEKWYQQYPKQISTASLVEVSGGRLKWYDIAVADAPVPDSIRSGATTSTSCTAADLRTMRALR